MTLNGGPYSMYMQMIANKISHLKHILFFFLLTSLQVMEKHRVLEKSLE